MKKYIFSSALLLVFLFGVMLNKQNSEHNNKNKSTKVTSKVIKEKAITDIVKPLSKDKLNPSTDPKKINKTTKAKVENNKPSPKTKTNSKKVLVVNDNYSDALDKKIERDIKEISAQVSEQAQGIKDEIDEEIIGLLNDSEEIADNDY